MSSPNLSFSVSQQDLLRSKVVKPGPYVLTIQNISQGPGKNRPDTIVTTIEMIVDSGPDPEAVGVPITHWISETAAGMAVEFLECAFGQKIPASGAQNMDLGKLIGRKVKAYIKNDKYNGKLTNRIEGFLPMK